MIFFGMSVKKWTNIWFKPLPTNPSISWGVNESTSILKNEKNKHEERTNKGNKQIDNQLISNLLLKIFKDHTVVTNGITKQLIPNAKNRASERYDPK